MELLSSNEIHEIGIEEYSQNGEIDLERTYENYIKLIIERNSEKYKDFSKLLNKTDLLAKMLLLEGRKIRVKLLKLTYLAMRIVDDICDNDILKSLSNDERLDLVNEIYNWNYSQIPVLSSIMSEIAKITDQLNFKETYFNWMHQIIHSMRYDLLRIIDPVSHKRTRTELEENFYKMDIPGTEWNSALLLWIDPNNTIEKALYLWRASRITLSLQDLHDDLYENIINIPIEDLEKFNISEDDILSVASMQYLWEWEVPVWIKKWIKQEIEQAKELLELHDEIFNYSNTLTKPPMEWWNGISNRYKSSVMVYAFKRWYKQEIGDIIKKTENSISWLDELWIEKVNPSRLFSVSESLEKAFAYYYSLNSWDFSSDVKKHMIKESNKLCEKYTIDLQITEDESERYFTKSKNLSLMYLWFLDSKNYTQEQIEWCIKAAFLSCAYDVCTDWWKWEEFKEKFEIILWNEVSVELKNIAMNLFNRDVSDELEDDWLDRWSVTVEFIWWCTWISDSNFIKQYWVSLNEMWRYLQMVDDIMDVEEDFDELEHNFLSNKETREKNLEDFIKFFQKKYFHKHSLLQIWINVSIKKAEKILEYLKNDKN